jgi:hypothetical protein
MFGTCAKQKVYYWANGLVKAGAMSRITPD